MVHLLKALLPPPGIDQILQINAYLIRIHPLSGAKCFPDVLGVYAALNLRIFFWLSAGEPKYGTLVNCLQEF